MANTKEKRMAVRIKFWRKPLPSMGEKNGIVVSSRKGTYGRDGDASDVIRVIPPGSKGSTGRQSRRN